MLLNWAPVFRCCTSRRFSTALLVQGSGRGKLPEEWQTINMVGLNHLMVRKKVMTKVIGCVYDSSDLAIKLHPTMLVSH